MTTSQDPAPLPPAKDAPAPQDEDAAQAAVAERHEEAADSKQDDES